MAGRSGGVGGGGDAQKQLLSLIRDFASEKSQGERRVVGLKKRIEELRIALETANEELDEAKLLKETTEQELKGYEVELALTDASIQALQARIALVQDEISTVGADIEGLKHQEGASRDGFIRQMFDLNSKIRKFQETIMCDFHKENSVGPAAEAGRQLVIKIVAEEDTRTLEDTLAHLVAQITKEDEEYVAEENIQKQVQQEYVSLQRKVSFIEAIMNETKALQDLGRQHAELEQTSDSLGKQLQKNCVCPSCHTDNSKALAGILQAN